MRYIELNPVRARSLTKHPSDYRWSSYHHNAWGKKDVLVTPHREYIRLGFSKDGRQSAYRQLFKACTPDKTINEIRKATNKAWVLGSESFSSRMATKFNRSARSTEHGGDRKSDGFKKQYV